MEIIQKNKNIIIIVGLIFLAVIIYISASKSPDNKTNDNIQTPEDICINGF
jgi:hypothetical protein